MVSIIAAKSLNNVIGINNTLPWKLSDELKHFKILTSNHHIIMGRKTYESIGKPLPNRVNVVVSRDEKYSGHNILVVNSLSEALSKARGDVESFIIGGEQIYKEAMEKDLVDKIYLTEIQKEFEGDAFFPKIDLENYTLVEETDLFLDSKSGLKYKYLTYNRLVPA